MNRAQKRALKHKKVSEEERKLSDKIFLFNKLPDQCNVCEDPFDKTDKHMVQSWSVVAKQETVRLFCPDCIKKTQEALNVSSETIKRFAKHDSKRGD